MKLLLQVFLLGIILQSCKVDLESPQHIIPMEAQEPWQLFLDYAPSDLKVKPFEIRLVGDIVWNGTHPSALTVHRQDLIFIDTLSWHYKFARNQLVLHELGHLILKREHLTGNEDYRVVVAGESLMPRSLMTVRWGVPDPVMRENNALRDYYLTELFSGH